MLDARLISRLDGVVYRLKVCAVALLVAFALAAFPIPFVPYPSIAQAVIEAVAAPAQGHLSYLMPGEGFKTYLLVATMVTLVLSMPVTLWQLLDCVTPETTPSRNVRLLATLIAAHLGFACGVYVSLVWILPTTLERLQTWTLPTIPGPMWQFSEYVVTCVQIMLTLGVIFEIPALVFGIVWLAIIEYQRVAAWRKYSMLLAFTFAALVTPTPDPTNQTLVAVPMYLAYELGLQLARLCPPDPTVPA